MRNLTVGICVSAILAGCGGGGSAPTPSASVSAVPNPTATINTSAKEVLRGDNVTVTWSSTNTSSCTASGDWTGNKATSGSETIVVSKDANTYTITCGSVAATANVTATLYQVNITTSALPNYSNSVVSTVDYVKGINYLPYAETFVTGQDGKMRVFVFPSLFYSGPTMPALELSETTANKFTLTKIHEDVRIGNARSIRRLNTASTTSKQFVVADTGLENAKDYNALPFGDVVVATDTGNGFSFKTISTNKAFYHNIAVGDITGDNKDDILVVNMGQRSGVDKTLYAYTQSSDGTFKQDVAFADETKAASLAAVSSGSVATGDLDGDGIPEVVHAAYINVFKPNWGAFRIFKKNYIGNYAVTKTYNREGYFNQAGAAVTTLVDIDNDSDLDIVFEMEGNTDPNNTTSFNMSAIEIYRNDGNLVFTRMTDSFLNKSMFVDKQDLVWTGGIAFIDFDNDGYVDMFLQQGGFDHYLDSKTVDIGAMILRNNNGKGFTTMAGKGLYANFTSIDNVLSSFKIMDKKGNTTRIFGFDKSGVPTVIEMRVGK